MSPLVLFSIIAAAVAIMVCVRFCIYEQFFRRRTPDQFGSEFHHIAKLEGPKWRAMAYEHGLTRSEWRRVVAKQAKMITSQINCKCSVTADH